MLEMKDVIGTWEHNVSCLQFEVFGLAIMEDTQEQYMIYIRKDLSRSGMPLGIPSLAPVTKFQETYTHVHKPLQGMQSPI
jgi:hypothetical protein